MQNIEKIFNQKVSNISYKKKMSDIPGRPTNPEKSDDPNMSDKSYSVYTVMKSEYKYKLRRLNAKHRII